MPTRNRPTVAIGVVAIALLLMVESCGFSASSETNQDGNDELCEGVRMSDDVERTDEECACFFPTDVEQGTCTLLGTIEVDSIGEISFVKLVTYTSTHSRKANSYILLYRNGKPFGYYFTGGDFFHSIDLDNSDLVIVYRADHNCRETTRISFQSKIPPELFIRCNGDYGDIYSFRSGFLSQ